ncbi:hypothetical protein BESB_083550 [Besnoitia besnoiti]|uniref:Leucine rich repeat-containing protein n=1 Tax=Besnoitia besnoiti TaxID=94643 RepID=A0A2A9MB52_BESBE|nr:hypothetical protein BESB_083550 [Besnoitia besnoiti]PFH33156.1 hypothetical protein BESB_083550 [Besnoitia besnoiti]
MPLASLVRAAPSLCELDWTYNRLGDTGIRILAEHRLRFCTSLEVHILNDSRVSSAGAEAHLDALAAADEGADDEEELGYYEGQHPENTSIVMQGYTQDQDAQEVLGPEGRAAI